MYIKYIACFFMVAFLSTVSLSCRNAENEKSKATNRNVITYESVVPIEWGEIVEFSMAEGSFSEGYLSYSIIMQEGEYLFSASGSNGLELSIKQQPIPYKEVDELRSFLEESGIDAWNGLAGGNDDDVMDGFGFRISFEIDNGSSFQASGSNNYPADFNTIFNALSFHIADMAFRYRTVQEWGNLVYMQYYVAHDAQGNGFYIYEIDIDSNNQIHINSRVSGGWPIVDGVFDYSVMEDIREIVSIYNIDQWYGDVRSVPENNHFITVDMRFDNDSSFSIRGYLSPSGFDEANEAILAFFSNLAS